MPAQRRRRRDLRTARLYAWSIVRQFRWTLGGLAAAVVLGGAMFASTPSEALGGRPPGLLLAFDAAWLALFGEQLLGPPGTWYLALLVGAYPLLGFGLIGEGIVRLGLLVVSKREGEKEWMKVMASTYRDHVVLCGLGHLGYRILGQLVASGAEVVALEKDAQGRFVAQAKEHVPVLVRDMKEDQALVDAGVPHARCIILATNDDIANLEVAMDARRMNPDIRIVMRMFDQQVADKIKGAMGIDAAFSSAALAAPIVAAMSYGARVLASFPVAGVAHVVSELRIEDKSALLGRTLGELEAAHAARVLARTPRGGPGEAPPQPSAPVIAGDTLVVELRAEGLSALCAAATAAS